MPERNKIVQQAVTRRHGVILNNASLKMYHLKKRKNVGEWDDYVKLVQEEDEHFHQLVDSIDWVRVMFDTMMIFQRSLRNIRSAIKEGKDFNLHFEAVTQERLDHLSSARTPNQIMYHEDFRLLLAYSIREALLKTERCYGSSNGFQQSTAEQISPRHRPNIEEEI